MMNEYISRITFDLIAKLRSRKSVSDEMLRDIHQLRCLRRKLNHEDPMVKLIDSADELVSYYANDI